MAKFNKKLVVRMLLSQNNRTKVPQTERSLMVSFSRSSCILTLYVLVHTLPQYSMHGGIPKIENSDCI